MIDQYEVDLTKSARRALAEQLPADVAMAAFEFILGPLADNPHRVGKGLDVPLDGLFSARIMREWRLLYEIDDDRRRIKIRSIQHRRDAYRSH